MHSGQSFRILPARGAFGSGTSASFPHCVDISPATVSKCHCPENICQLAVDRLAAARSGNKCGEYADWGHIKGSRLGDGDVQQNSRKGTGKLSRVVCKAVSRDWRWAELAVLERSKARVESYTNLLSYRMRSQTRILAVGDEQMLGFFSQVEETTSRVLCSFKAYPMQLNGSDPTKRKLGGLGPGYASSLGLKFRVTRIAQESGDSRLV
jgi:hypothetical protein